MMRNKILLNVLYNLGLIICIYVIYEGYTHGHYFYVAGAALVAGIFVTLKVKLLQEVRAMQKQIKK